MGEVIEKKQWYFALRVCMNLWSERRAVNVVSGQEKVRRKKMSSRDTSSQRKIDYMSVE